MNKKNIKGTIVIIMLLASIVLFGFSTGITGVTQKGSSPGCTCHAPSPTSTVNVAITGPETLEIGEDALYTVTITGGPLAAAGTNIAVSGGTLAPENGLRLQSAELTHVSPRPAVSGQVVYTFQYTAPATPGTQTIYANGNSVNLNGNNTGDQWNFAPNKIITVTQVTAVNDKNSVYTFDLKQNYPNPFNPSTKINYSLQKSEHVKLVVYNTLGDEIAVLVNELQEPGSHSTQFDASQLSSGVYFYKLTSGNNTLSRKMLLLK